MKKVLSLLMAVLMIAAAIPMALAEDEVVINVYHYAVEEAIRLDCSDVTLNVWEGNNGAKRFYEKMGMRPKETMMEYDL